MTDALVGYRYDRCDRCYRLAGVAVVRCRDEAPRTWLLVLLCGPCWAAVGVSPAPGSGS